MIVVRAASAIVALWLLTACSGSSPVTSAPHPRTSQSPSNAVLRPYEEMARNVPASAPPAIGHPFDVKHSVAVPNDIAEQVLGALNSTRKPSDEQSVSYALVAVQKTAAASSRRSPLDDGTTCYYLVTYVYNVRTGEIVAILDVTFEGCSGSSLAGDGSGAGGGSTGPSPTNPGCSNADKTAGKAYAGIGAGNPIFNDPPPNSSGQEMYGYIYQNGNSYAYDTPTTVNIVSGHDAFIPQPNAFPGWTPIGLYHTHPHQPDVETSQVDVETGNHFSQSDINTAISDGYPIYVAVLDTLQSNSLSESPAVRWYKYDPATRQETTMNLVGSGGC